MLCVAKNTQTAYLKAYWGMSILTLKTAAGVPSSLTTIALGALKYWDVWDGTDVDRGSAADDYLMLRTYSIDYRQNAVGDYAPLLRLRAKGPTRHIKPSCSDISILEPYWLA